MRIAILSDIHGNPIALDAVVADATSGNLDAPSRKWEISAGAPPFTIPLGTHNHDRREHHAGRRDEP